MELQEFLQKNRIDHQTWNAADISWEELTAIFADHESNRKALEGTAELLARTIQSFPAVHSVRWRIKDSEHLLEKIVRKRASKQDKYLSLTPANYFEVVTDLVGVRALHLFKEDCFRIGELISASWTVTEPPAAYVRTGDPAELTDKFKNAGLEVKEHPAGYRSVHYVVSTKPMLRTIFAELQVRTIFEEGWSEIDHRVRYPNYSDNPLVGYFLTIFNRLAGSADEMGAFVQGLVAALNNSSMAITLERQEKENVLASMDQLIGELGRIREQDAQSRSKVEALQKLKRKSCEGAH